jgi:hypothetical protein
MQEWKFILQYKDSKAIEIITAGQHFVECLNQARKIFRRRVDLATYVQDSEIEVIFKREWRTKIDIRDTDTLT